MKIEDFISNLKEKVEALQVTEFKSESVEIKVVNDNLKKSVFSDKNSYEVKAKINGKYVKINTEQLTPNLYEILKQQSEIIELSDRYQYISKDIFEKFKKDYEEIINVYNNQVQNEYQEELEKNDFEYYSFIEKFREFASKPIIWVSKTKIASKINKKIINRIREKSDSYSKFTKKIAQKILFL